MSERAARRRMVRAGGIALALLLTGCDFPGAGDDAGRAPATSVSSGDASPASGGAAAGANGAGAALPASYPTDEVPLVKGTIVSADVIPGMGWNVVLTPQTPLDQVADEAGALVMATGFTQHTQARSKPDNRGYRSDKYEIYINRQDEDGTVSYTVLTR